VYKKRLSENKFELDLLNNSTITSKRFCNNFVKQIGNKRTFEMNLSIMEKGRMINDYDVLKDLPAQCTIVCSSTTAEVIAIKKEDYTELEKVNEEQYRELIKIAVQWQNMLKTDFMRKLEQTLSMMSQANGKDGDIKMMCNTLMREMLWDQPPRTLELYSLKKHIKGLPELRD
jgi:hypothetical protein